MQTGVYCDKDHEHKWRFLLVDDVWEWDMDAANIFGFIFSWSPNFRNEASAKRSDAFSH